MTPEGTVVPCRYQGRVGGWVLSGGGVSLPCRPGRQTPAVIPAREKASLRDLERKEKRRKQQGYTGWTGWEGGK